MSESKADVPEPLRDEPFEPEVLSSDLVYEGYVWDVRSDRVRYGDGEIVRQYVAHPGAVAILAMDDEERVLLIQQYRHPIRHRDWELPAGLLDIAGEEPLAAARRELAEEADLVAAHWEPLVSSWTTPGGNDELIRVFLATGLSTAETAHDREDEEADIRVAWVPLDEAVAGVLEGRLHNGILSIGVLAAAQRLRDRS
ncbi:NUDIX domain-containing protein [Microbacterium paraoxydans]|jgi:8-oxo-dGDP phosphatase|uniref:ADP-ribose pyrophosphatase n=1 Tax=Microbacterium paraoxydans TaxID=199592 RepID=A0A1H1NS34_9MICO|nr:NUDIX hydrolase [Microbacterium paraoxydans]SDS01772.1 ADP-ribose pyrophosphatase [Microbacterium paraoxydans]